MSDRIRVLIGMIASAASGHLAGFALFVIGFAGAGAGFFFVSYLEKAWLRPRARGSRALCARATTRPMSTEDPRAWTSDRALEFASDEYLATHPSRPGVAGELWVRDYVGRLQNLLPGFRSEAPATASEPDEDVFEMDVSESAVLDEDDDVGVLCASAVVAEEGPSPAHVRATDVPVVPMGPSPAHAKTLILGAMQGLAGLDAPIDHPRRR